jgi:ElaB/YqjD/DUF883 family membrane-anchored ribosome-binding protein
MALWRAAAAKDNFDTLRSKLDTLREESGTFVSTLKDNGSSRAEVDAIRQRLATLSSDLQASDQQQLRKLEAQVRERPYTSLALAFATGLIIGGRPFDADAPFRLLRFPFECRPPLPRD